MKKKMVYLLDQKDEKAIAILEKFGIAKTTARALMYVTQVDECRSVDIEQGADLREPEVCRAMKDLLRRGWVKKSQQKNHRKGRPQYIYKALYRFHDLVESFEREKIQEIKNEQRVLSALKRYVDTNTVPSIQRS